MAGEILKFVVEVDSATGEANMRKFNEQLRATGEAAKTASTVTGTSLDKLQNQLSAFGSTAMSLGRTLSLAVTAPIAAVGVLGIRFNAMQEQAKVAFTSMIGSASMAQLKLEELKDFAARTPFQFPDLVRATQRLMAYGFAARETIPILTAVGDASAALGGSAETIERIVLAFGQIRAKGTLQSQEMRQLAEAGIPAWEILAKHLGVTIPEAMDKTEKRAVSATVALAALTEGINTRFGGMMEKQAHTFQGLISTIMDESRFLAGALTEGLFNAIKGPMEKATNALHNFRVEIERMPDSIKTVVAVTAGLVALAGPALFLTGALAGSIANIIKLGTLLAGMAGITTLSGGLLLVGEAIAVIGAALAGLYIAKQIVDILRLGDSFKMLGAEVVRLAGNAPQGLKLLSDAVHGLATEIKGLIGLIPGLGSIGKAIEGLVSTAIIVKLGEITAGLKLVNEFIEGSVAPVQPAGTNAAARSAGGGLTRPGVPGALEALNANEERMQRGIPAQIKSPVDPKAAGELSDFQKQVDSMFKSLNKYAQETEALVAVLKKAQAAHISNSEIVEKFSKQIEEASGRVNGLSKADADLIRGMAEQVRIQERAKDTIERNKSAMGEYIDKLTDANIETTTESELFAEMETAWQKNEKYLFQNAKATYEYNKAVQSLNDSLEWSRNLVASQPSGKQLFLLPTPGMNEPNFGVQNPGPMTEGLPRVIRDTEEEAKRLADTLSNSLGRAIERLASDLADAVIHAKGFSQAIKNVLDSLAKGILTAFFTGLLAPLQMKMQDFGVWLSGKLQNGLSQFTDKVKELFDSLGKMAGVVAGAVTGFIVGYETKSKTKGILAGASTGAVVGGEVGGPWGAVIGAVAGALAGIAGALVGVGRSLANVFVKDVQNPFGANLSNVVDPFNTGAQAGTITKSQGMQAREQVVQFWNDFQKQAAEFAAKGGTEAKVAMQGLATVGPIVARILDDMDGTIAQLGSTAQKTTIQFQQAVEQMLNSITSYADNADVLEETIRQAIENKVPMQLIIQALGQGIASTVDQLTLMGREIPPNILAVSEAMKTMGETAVITASQFEQAVTQIMNSITSNADSADILETAVKRSIENKVPHSLIIDALGNRIQQTVKELTALGRDVPPTLAMLSAEIDAMGKSATEATKALKSGPDAVELVQMRISAYNSGFQVGQLVNSPNASRYNFSGVPRGTFTERTYVAPNQAPVVRIDLNLTEGDFNLTTTDPNTDMVAQFKEALKDNRNNLTTTVTKAVQEAMNAPTPPRVL